MGEYFSNMNGINLYDRARAMGERNLRGELERFGLCGLGMFNDQIDIRLNRGHPLSFCYKYGGGEILILPNGRILIEEGHDEDLTEEYIVGEVEEIFEAPLQRVELGVVE